MIARALRVLALAALAGAAGCDDSPAGAGTALKAGLAAAEAAGRLPPLETDAVDSPAELARVLDRPYAQLAPRLGGLRQQVESTFVIGADGEREVSLEEKVTLLLDARGAFSLRHVNAWWSREDQDGQGGRACWWVDGRFYTARAHGPATEVPVRHDEADHCLETAVEPLTGLLRMLLPHLRVMPSGVDRVAGRDVLKVVLQREGQGISFPPPLPRAWKEAPEGGGAAPEGDAIWGPRPPLVVTHTRPVRLEGELALDRETGVPVAGRLEGRLTLTKGGREAQLDFRVVLGAGPADEAVTPPERARPARVRQRVFEDRRRLLGESFKEKDKGKLRLPQPGDAPPLEITSGREEAPTRPTAADREEALE